MSLFLLNIKLPVPISSAMSSMGAMMGPLSMFVVGMLLSKVSWKDVFANIRAYLIVLIRLIIATDAHSRKRGEQIGLDTLVVHAVNDRY